MSVAIRRGFAIRVIAWLMIFGTIVYFGLERVRSENRNILLSQALHNYQSREDQYLRRHQELESQVQELEIAKAELEQRLQKFESNITSLNGQIQDFTLQRDQWEKRVQSLTKQRDQLVKKFRQEIFQRKHQDATQATQIEAQLAQALQEKQRLEAELNQLKTGLLDDAQNVAGLKQQSLKVQDELSAAQLDQQRLTLEAKEQQQLAEKFAVELAKSKKEKNALNRQLQQILDENAQLQERLQAVASSKMDLEQGLAMAKKESQQFQKKIQEMERTLAKSGPKGIELSPIVVSARHNIELPQVMVESLPSPQNPTFDGNVVSVDPENNFVIIDIGNTAGLKLGDVLNVYRGAQYIGGLEVIQVRNDIAAADIKKQVTEFQVGDVVSR